MTLVVSILSNKGILYLIIKKTAKSIQQPLLIIVLSCPLAEYIGYRLIIITLRMIANHPIVSLIIINKISSKTKHHNNNRKKELLLQLFGIILLAIRVLCHTLYTIGFHSATYRHIYLTTTISEETPPIPPTITVSTYYYYLYFSHAALFFDDTNIVHPIPFSFSHFEVCSGNILISGIQNTLEKIFLVRILQET